MLHIENTDTPRGPALAATTADAVVAEWAESFCAANSVGSRRLPDIKRIVRDSVYLIMALGGRPGPAKARKAQAFLQRYLANRAESLKPGAWQLEVSRYLAESPEFSKAAARL